MLYRDRLNDEYEAHQRRFNSTNEAEENLVSGAEVSHQTLVNELLARLGDGLIHAGSSIKKHNDRGAAVKLSPTTR